MKVQTGDLGWAPTSAECFRTVCLGLAAFHPAPATPHCSHFLDRAFAPSACASRNACPGSLLLGEHLCSLSFPWLGYPENSMLTH